MSLMSARSRSGFLLPFAFCLLLPACADAVRAQVTIKPGATEKRPAAESAAPVPAAIPLPEIPAQAELASINLRDIESTLAAGAIITAIEQELPALSREIDARFREVVRIMAYRPSLQLLERLEWSWRRLRETVVEWNRRLEQRARRLDRDRTRVTALEGAWTETLQLAKESGDAELVRRVDSLLAGMGRTRSAVDKQRAHVVQLQSRVTAQDLRITEALELLRQAREETLGRLFFRDSPPLWDSRMLEGTGAIDSQESWQTQLAALKSYFSRTPDRFVMHAVIFVLLAAGLFWVRGRSAAFAAQDPALERAARVFMTPLATALVISFLGARWIYPQAPRLLWVFIGIAALIPTIIVLRPIVEQRLRVLLYAAVAFFLVDQARAVTASMGAIPRLVFVAEMAAGALLLLGFLRTLRHAAVAPSEERRIRRHRIGAGIACAVFLAAAVAGTTGYMALGDLLGNTMLEAGYLGVVLYAVVQILDSTVVVALRTRPLNLLGMVQRHQELLRRRTGYLLTIIAGALWSLFVLQRLALWEPVVDGLNQGLGAELHVGSISFSLGDIIAFILVVWASFAVSRLVRFFLDEDVYPRARMERGLYYAVSRTVHYLILLGGFFFAVAVLGVDMTKLTILAGAFTVGVGFGLQNIFNNFVSGLILLFERPVQVGDMIQIEDTSGIVERIGIRASVVRAATGPEIIVPNGRLISERLINWTLSARRRGLELPIAVVRGADPRRVIAIVERAAAAHPRVQSDPPPQVFFTRLGPDWMGFELRAYTAHVESWMSVRSELAVAVNEALAAENIAMK
jgi:potassium-dependent mechanosensitive channel